MNQAQVRVVDLDSRFSEGMLSQKEILTNVVSDFSDGHTNAHLLI